jgi:hypothetical protein
MDVREPTRTHWNRTSLERKLQQALRLTDQMKQQGYDEEEAFQNASDLILAPIDGPPMLDNPPKPLLLKERKAI